MLEDLYRGVRYKVAAVMLNPNLSGRGGKGSAGIIAF